jgi:hypothetical protein
LFFTFFKSYFKFEVSKFCFQKFVLLYEIFWKLNIFLTWIFFKISNWIFYSEFWTFFNMDKK